MISMNIKFNIHFHDLRSATGVSLLLDTSFRMLLNLAQEKIEVQKTYLSYSKKLYACIINNIEKNNNHFI